MLGTPPYPAGLLHKRACFLLVIPTALYLKKSKSQDFIGIHGNMGNFIEVLSGK
jgi:hypothetical protein